MSLSQLSSSKQKLLDTLTDKITLKTKDADTFNTSNTQDLLELKDLYCSTLLESLDSSPQPPILTFKDINKRLPYHPNTKIPRTSIHIGQRKLFISELRFLTEFTFPNKETIVIYAGAAPGSHILHLSSLFPTCKFLLVDPAPFEIPTTQAIQHKNTETTLSFLESMKTSPEKLWMINDYFTDNLAEQIRTVFNQDYLFISDIRTNTGRQAPNTNNSNSFQPDTVDILWNMAQQLIWTIILEPRMCLFKFRHPFYSDDPVRSHKGLQEKKDVFDKAKELALKAGLGEIDFLQNAKNKTLVYFNGQVQLQAWAGETSTETRLVTDAREFVNWGTPGDYDNAFFYYNSIARCYYLHDNPNAAENIGFDLCNDCAIENHAWEQYLFSTQKMSSTSNKTVLHFVRELTQATNNRTLLMPPHGHLFSADPDKILDQVQVAITIEQSRGGRGGRGGGGRGGGGSGGGGSGGGGGGKREVSPKFNRFLQGMRDHISHELYYSASLNLSSVKMTN